MANDSHSGLHSKSGSMSSLDSQVDLEWKDNTVGENPTPLSKEALESHRKAMASIAPILESFTPKRSVDENTVSSNSHKLEKTTSNVSSLSIGANFGSNPNASNSATGSQSGTTTGTHTPKNRAVSVSEVSGPELPKIGKIGVCAMDAKVLSKPCRQILNRLIANGEFETVIFGDKVILDESVENWPTCDFLISFFSTGFPLDKAIEYVKLRKPYFINNLVMQKALWDRRLVLELLNTSGVASPERLVISRDGGPIVDKELKAELEKHGVCVEEVKEPNWEMIDEDTLCVDGKVLKKPFVEKPVDGEDHNVYIYYSSKNGGGGRRLFRKIGNKSSEFDKDLSMIRTKGSYIYEKFMDTDHFEDVKAYTVGPNFCHAETRKSPVVDGIVRRNTHGKEIRFITNLSTEEKLMASKVCTAFDQTICGFDLLRVSGKSYVIDVNGFSFVKDNDAYYDSCSSILRELFLKEKTRRDSLKVRLPFPVVQEEKTQKWVFKGIVSVIRHADRTPKQKFKYSFRSPLFVSLLKGHKEEIIIRQVEDLKIVHETVLVAQREKAEDPTKLAQLAGALEKKMTFPGTKVQLKPSLDEDNNVEKVQLIIKWGGEPTHSAQYQATDVGEQLRQDVRLLNKDCLKNVKVFTSSERRVVASAKLFSSSFLGEKELPDDYLEVRKDLLDDSNAAKDLMDKVKKKLKPLLRQGKDAPPQFAWPPKMPEPFVVIKRVVELMNYHHKLMEHNFAIKDVAKLQTRWCCGEDAFLFKERWDKLFQEFISVEKVHPSKISELYDTMKYDALHNRSFLQGIFLPDDAVHEVDLEQSPCLVREYPINILAMNNFRITDSSSLDTSSSPNTVGSIGWILESDKHSKSKVSGSSPGSPFDSPKFAMLRELYRLAKVLFDFICPQEYGIEDNEKLDIGLLTSLPLAKQILSDISEMRDSGTAGSVIYFTKESHIYTLLNVIYESQLPMKIARNALPELDYLSQIVFELYESEDKDGNKKHAIRLSLSPGCHTQDPLDVQLDAKHYISCIRRISLTRHLDMDLVTQRLKSRFSRVRLPKRFTPVNISSPLTVARS
ncbi:BA75_01554T0 [Komagataella pastoris]|uniref:Inositol hexakisphosphate and diphosphoinositol-pentakisphosphate kinase n=1 Tax=Komagataella pastoris TaxID=4922 RepID=A0A1B2J6I9_PICPA|nr:BA75_01554T0 [Komagataella pastoris]